MRRPAIVVLAFATFGGFAAPAARPCEVGSHQVLDAPSEILTSTTIARRGEARNLRTARKAALKQLRDDGEINRRQYLLFRTALAVFPGFRDMVDEELLDVAAEQGLDISGPEVRLDLDQFERLLQILIEYLPQLIDIFLKLFGETSAASAVQAPAAAVPAPGVSTMLEVPLSLAA